MFEWLDVKLNWRCDIVHVYKRHHINGYTTMRCEIKRNYIIFMDSLCESNRFQISERILRFEEVNLRTNKQNESETAWDWWWIEIGMGLTKRAYCIHARTHRALNCIHKCIRPIKGEIREFGWLTHTHTHIHKHSQHMQTCTIYIHNAKSPVWIWMLYAQSMPKKTLFAAIEPNRFDRTS